MLIALAALAAMVGAIALMRVTSRRQVPGAEPAIRAFLERRGQRLLGLEPLPLGGRHPDTGLSSEAVVYEVRAADADGQEQTYEWAYDPTRSPSGEKGVYRWSMGAWIRQD